MGTRNSPFNLPAARRAGPLAGKTVFITGASSGIGAALAREAAKRGADLILFARRVDRLTGVKAQAEAFGARVLLTPGDVTKEADLRAAVAAAQGEFGKIDCAVANAGFGIIGKFERLTDEDYRRQFETNIYGVLRTCRAAIPALKATRGSLAVVGSVMSYVSTAADTPYAMSKAAVRSLADSLYIELKPFGIAVSLILPGFVKTEIRGLDNQGNPKNDSRDPVPDWLNMDADVAARHILRAIEKRKREAVITNHGKILVWWRRFFPGLLFWAMARVMPKARENK